MEKKFKRIPFDLELAKAITNGKKEGRVVADKGQSVTILSFNNGIELTPISAIIGDIEPQNAYCFKIDGSRNNKKLFLEVPDEQEFNEGDVVFTTYCNIAIFKRQSEDGETGQKECCLRGKRR